MTSPESGGITVSAIVAVARNNVIGRDNRLPWHIPADLKYFKAMTLGRPIVMGRRSWDSLGRPLPGRMNIVVSRTMERLASGAGTAHFGEHEESPLSAEPSVASLEEGPFLCPSIESALQLARKAAARLGKTEIMIAGGAQIYAAAMPYTQRLYLTRIERAYDGDTVWPGLEEKDWRLVSEEKHDGDPPFAFQIFDRIG
jgi:dihydrofolate reductase